VFDLKKTFYYTEDQHNQSDIGRFRGSPNRLCFLKNTRTVL